MKGRTNMLAVFGCFVIFIFMIVFIITLPLVNSTVLGLDFTSMPVEIRDLWNWGFYAIAVFSVVGMIKFGWGARW